MCSKLLDNIAKIINATQFTAACHQREVGHLIKLYENANPNEFCKEFKICLKGILISDEKNYKEKNPNLHRIMDFIAKFCTTINAQQDEDDEEEHPLFAYIFDILLLGQAQEKAAVRYRSCQIISKIFEELTGQEISEARCTLIRDALVERADFEMKHFIRLEAMKSLYRLQDPTDLEDPVILSYAKHMQDGFAKIRELVVEKIAFRKDTIPKIIPRISDIDVNVRLAAFKRLSQIPTKLRISDRRLILKSGAADISPKVAEYMQQLIDVWLNSYDNNILVFMKSLRLDANEKDIEETVKHYKFVLEYLFKKTSIDNLLNVLVLNDERLPEFNWLNWETISYWVLLLEYLTTQPDYEDIEVVLPEFMRFRTYIKDFCNVGPKDTCSVDFVEYQFILSELFTITKMYDYSDDVRGNHLNSLVAHVLETLDLTENVTKIIVGNLELTIQSQESRGDFIMNIINNIMFPAVPSTECHTDTIEVAKMNFNINLLTEEMETALKVQDFLEANRLKIEIETSTKALSDLKAKLNTPMEVEKLTDVATIVKCLNIAIAYLVSPKVTALNYSFTNFKNDEIIHQGLIVHENDTVKAKAFKCYALCCIIDRKSAKYGIHIFSLPITAYSKGEECDNQILLVCIGAVTDLLRLYGSKLIAEPPENDENVSDSEDHVRNYVGGTSLTEVIQGLVDLMDNDEIEIQETAGQALCCLVQSGRVDSASLVSRLILKWCNPVTESRLTQILSVTLEQIPLLPGSAAQLEDAVFLTIKDLIDAPRSSPLSEVNAENVAKFVLTLCSTSPNGPLLHSNIAQILCKNIKEQQNNQSTYTFVLYSKMLLMLKTPVDVVVVNDLLQVCNDILSNKADYHKTILTNISKFIKLLNGSNSVVPSSVSETIAEANEDEETAGDGEDGEGTEGDE